MLMECRPLTERQGQVRAHLKHVGFRLVGDDIYGGPPLMLSSIKHGYRLKPGAEERPLIARPALHLGEVIVKHPATGNELRISSPPAKDFAVSLKYLRRFALTS
jgi:23S rRNA-/tRNA-specific pseudouridylate synthase